MHRTVGRAWLNLLSNTYLTGATTRPRGKVIRETLGTSVTIIEPVNNIFMHPERGLNYRFMVAEWLWIWFGHNDVATIARYNKNIAQFSDDGVTFNGAYGVPVYRWWSYVAGLLRTDPDSRQAVIDVYDGRATGTTKDVPCTLSIQFLIRDAKLHTFVTMRSQDLWLGFPYDAFTFTMLANIMAAEQKVPLGWLTLNVGSSHIYETNFDQVLRVLGNADLLEEVASPALAEPPLPWLEGVLTDQRPMYDVGLVRPWFDYGNVLLSRTSAEGLDRLRGITR